MQVNEVFENKDDLEFEDLSKLVYLEQCIKETLRIHPPVLNTFRKNHHSSETVCNIHIPKGDIKKW
jgi:cytochrome P450